MSKPVLTYMPIAARGETALLICKVGGLEIEHVKSMGAPEGVNPNDYFSPSGLPILKHGDLQVAQSLPIEDYLSSIAPKYAGLTPQQRAIDGCLCAIKEDMCQGCAKPMFAKCNDPEVLKKVLDTWLTVVEHKCPESGFFNGLELPTAADFACLVMTEGYMPYVAALKQAGVDLEYYKKFPKLAGLVKRTMEFPDVAEYLKANDTLKAAAMGF